MAKLMRKAVTYRRRLVTMRSVFRLISGHDFDWLEPGRPLTDSELRAAWRLVGTELRAEVARRWGQDSGVEPWGHWYFTAGIAEPHEAGDCPMGDGGYCLRLLRSGEWPIPSGGA